MFDYNLKSLSFYFMIVSLIAIYSLSGNISKEFNEYFELEGNKVKLIFNAIFYEDGYMNSTEQPWCSDSQTLTDITAHRLIQCTGLRNITLKEASSGQESDPTQSYIAVMEKYGKGCNFYFKSNSAEEMVSFIECDIRMNTIPLEKLERDWSYFFEENFSQEYILTNTEYEALDINTGTGGAVDDGKLRMTFRK